MPVLEALYLLVEPMSDYVLFRTPVLVSISTLGIHLSGHFLSKDSGIWVEVDHESINQLAREKVSSMFRTRRKEVNKEDDVVIKKK
jgi:hypothetical protein